MPLTASQEIIKREIIKSVREGEKRIVLKGSAGTGKTFMTNEIIKTLKRDLYSYGAVYVTAPTHKALAVLKTKIEAKPYIHFNTIHSALSLKHKRNYQTGQSYFEQVIHPRFPPFKSGQAVILDEASMAEKDILKYIEDHPNLLFIFAGDHKQLNPVHELDSPAFMQGWKTFELTEIVRQGAGNPIIELSNNLDWIKKHKGKDNLTALGGYFYDNRRSIMIEKLAEVNGTDDLKYLAYTNPEVTKMNLEVRKRIYNTPHKIEKLETLVFGAPYLHFTNNQEFKVDHLEIRNTDLFVPNSQTILDFDENGVGKIKPVFKQGVEVQTYTRVPAKVYIINGLIKVLHEDSEEEFKNILKHLKADATNGKLKWPIYYWFLEQFADIRYNHAITVHKSQGSTYRRAIVNMQNIGFNSNSIERTRMIYTAITRASEKVCLFNVK